MSLGFFAALPQIQICPLLIWDSICRYIAIERRLSNNCIHSHDGDEGEAVQVTWAFGKVKLLILELPLSGGFGVVNKSSTLPIPSPSNRHSVLIRY